MIHSPAKKIKHAEGIIFIILFLGFFGILATGFIPSGEKLAESNLPPYIIGVQNMVKTMMMTAYDLLMGTVWYLLAIMVLMGGLSKLFTEFGVVAILERLLRPVMKPLFNLPGIAALGGVVTFLSDNPAIITLSKDKQFSRYFKTYQLVSLTNFGTAFGMGLIVVLFMFSMGYVVEPFIGLIGACVGCLISTRLMQRFTLRSHPEFDTMYVGDEVVVSNGKPDQTAIEEIEAREALAQVEAAEAQKEGVFMRFLNAMLDGGKSGVALGMTIIPGVLIITTIVLVLTTPTPKAELAGLAGQGVGFLPWICDKVQFLFDWTWGFDNPEFIAFPLTALGSVGAALGVAQDFASETKDILNGNAVAVFTAIGMVWSGYLSTHAAMLDSMGFRKLISKAILAHTIAGALAGVVAHWLYVLICG